MNKREDQKAEGRAVELMVTSNCPTISNNVDAGQSVDVTSMFKIGLSIVLVKIKTSGCGALLGLQGV